MIGTMCIGCASQLSTHGSQATPAQKPVHVTTLPSVRAPIGAYSSPHLDLTFPETQAGLTIASVTEYEPRMPGMGTAFHYHAPNAKASIYLYTAGMPQILDGIESGVMRGHFEQVVQEIFRAEKRGLYVSVSRLDADGVVVLSSAGHFIPLLHASFKVSQQGTERLSYLSLTGYRNHFVKVRLTYDSADAEATHRAVVMFLGELGRLLLNDDQRAHSRSKAL